MTLLGNSVEMSRQEENDPFIGNKRSKRSMRDKNQRPHHEGSGSRIASHAVHTPPRNAFFSLFTCPYRISQQSHSSRPAPIMNFHDQSRSCHPERSEGSVRPSRQTLRSAQGDQLLPVLLVKNHYRQQSCPTNLSLFIISSACLPDSFSKLHNLAPTPPPQSCTISMLSLRELWRTENKRGVLLICQTRSR